MIAPPALQRWRRFAQRPRVRQALRLARFAGGMQPLTVAGVVLLVASGLAFVYIGVAHLDLIILIASGTVFIITILMVLLVVLAAFHMHYNLRHSKTRSPLQMECDLFQWTGFQVAFSRWVPCVIAEWGWNPMPDKVETWRPREEGNLVETVRPHHRGVYHQISRRVSLRDLLGLVSISWDLDETVDVEVLPSRGRLENMEVLSALVWGDDVSDPRGDPSGDRVDMRQYAVGDSPRMILWKVYARSRKLMVRIPERAITARPRACAYVVSGADTEPVAGLARVVLENHLLGEGWRFGADGSPTYATRLHEALHLLAKSGNPDPEVEAGAGLSAYMAQAVNDGYASLFLFVPPQEGPWVAHVQAALARTPLRVSMFVGSDRIVDVPTKEPRWRRYVFQPPPAPGPGPEELSSVTRLFSRSVAEVWRVDRKAGRLFTDSNYRTR